MEKTDYRNREITEWYRRNYLSCNTIRKYDDRERWENTRYIMDYEILPNGRKNIKPMAKRKLKKVSFL